MVFWIFKGFFEDKKADLTTLIHRLYFLYEEMRKY